MKAKINNPDMFERAMKVSGVRMWLVLSVLTVLISTGLTLFLSNRIMVTVESDLCYVFGETMSYQEAITKSAHLAFPQYAHLYENSNQAFNDYPLDGLVQPIVLSYDKDDHMISEGMRLHVQDRSGEVLIRMLPISFQKITEMGYLKEDLLKAGFIPDKEYSFIYAVLYLPDGTEPLSEGMKKVEVLLDELEPVTLLLK